MEMQVSKDNLWLIMQLCDSSFPGGSLANSQGLESAVQHGFVVRNDVGTLKKYIDLLIIQVVNQLFPYTRTGAEIAINDDSIENKMKMLIDLDSHANCTLSNEISRRSSINQGKCFFRVITEVFYDQSSTIKKLFDQILILDQAKSDKKMNYHYAPLFGFICSALGLPMGLIDQVFIRNILRDLLSAASRLNIVGPLECSILQSSYYSMIETTMIKYDNFNDLDKDLDIFTSIKFYNDRYPSQTVPILELIQTRHDILYSRLFNS